MCRRSEIISLKIFNSMYVLGLCGTSGSGKTRLAQRLVAMFAAKGHRVSVVKHAHHDVDVDIPGKDSWVLRKAGAYETMLISSKRWMLIRELEKEQFEPDIHEVIADIKPCDWLIIEGFKHADLNKIEVWRECVGKPAIYLQDDYVKAVVTDDVTLLSDRTDLPVLQAEDTEQVFDWVIENKDLFVYER